MCIRDRASHSSLKKVFETFQPNIVINAAAYTKVDEAESNQKIAKSVNYVAVKSLSELCAANSSFLIHFSTDYVFDGSMARLYGETDPANPLNVYGQSKLAGDEHIIKHAQKYAIFRLAWVYDDLGINFPKKILNAAKSNCNIKVIDDQFDELVIEYFNIAIAFCGIKYLFRKVNSQIIIDPR